ncbi:S8 family serine peptidase [Bifidobacterium psychraerophilum]|uniref:Subtilisin family peptidase n=1 Tax=Bifidobacterium psychraerophilum TaxID=218140 RepID=A0A087CGG5_9BIFI|nr:S8 family serine peptidase [Bifidobacterium psychraerophilum]KFI82365.1 subtilisin family peptidase [Bifidobacterium psychraerophilum]PKA95167.1 putative sugar-binding protein [Bifidobacterium psychraerophilum DSM 22366]
MNRRNRGRWSALVVALAMLLPTVGTAVAHADTQQSGKVQVASQITKGSGTMPVFIQTTSKSALSVSGSKSPSAFKGKKALQDTAKDTAEKADDTSRDVLGELQKLDPKVKTLYTTAYTVPGIAVYADAAALRKLAEQSDSVSKINPISFKTTADSTENTDDTTGATGENSPTSSSSPRSTDSSSDDSASKDDTQTDGSDTQSSDAKSSEASSSASDKGTSTKEAQSQDVQTSGSSGQHTSADNAAIANAEPKNANSDALVQALKTWTQTGNTGKNTNIAIVDTGLDYTHADFGGAGTTAAYDTALASKGDPLTDSALTGLLDTKKFKGGYDFAGTNYNPDSTDPAIYTPSADANPIDGKGGHHGTHVAGTALGYGVNADGTTYRGDYSKLSETELQSMEVGPGSAPEAGVYSLKVFGDNGGTTGLVGEALDWVGEQIANGTSINIVSMSVGGSYGSDDDPDTAKVDALTEKGVLSVIAAGNEGDFTDVLGSPGSAKSALTVAASSSGRTLQDGITATAPSDVAGTKLAGQYSANYADLSDINVEGTVVKLKDAGNLAGCNTYSTEDAAAVKGNIAWVNWDDNNLVCGSKKRFDNAEAAGAKAILFQSDKDIPDAGIAGNATLPGFQVTPAGLAKVQSALDAGTLTVKLSSDQRLSTKVDYSAKYEDTMASFTSRGIHGSADGTAKPDVSAPGVGIISASAGTGSKAEVMSGTSMATPMTSGIAALTYESHPGWSAKAIKAQLMNTADHDVLSEDRSTKMGPLRVGTGRVDAYEAVNNQATVAATDDPTAVTGEFGIVQVPRAGYSRSKSFTVSNKADKPVTYSLSYQARVSTPGVDYQLDKKTITVPANGSANFTVTLSIPDQSLLRHTRDTTQPVKNPASSDYDSNYVTDASGIVRLVPTDTADGTFSALRVSMVSAPKPVSETSTSLEFSKGSADGQVVVSGKGFANGTGATGYTSQLAPMQLAVEDPVDGYTSQDSARSLAAADIRAVGVSSTAPQINDKSQGYLTFGIETDKTWSRLGNSFFPEIVLDSNGDGTPDVLIGVNTVQSGAMTDAVWVETVRLSDRTVIDREAIVDSTVADSNVVLLPVKLSALGITKDSTAAPMHFYAQTESLFAQDAENAYLADTTDVASFDPLNPDLWFGKSGQNGSGSAVENDKAGTIQAHLKTAVDSSTAGKTRLSAKEEATGTTAQPQALLLHLNGAVPVAKTASPVIDIQSIAARDTSELQKLVDTADALKESTYTPESWKQLAQALANAKDVLADAGSTNQQINAAYNALNTAINGLVKMSAKVDKSKLQGLHHALESLQSKDYTKDSWAAFEAAMKAAQQVLNNANATQAEVNSAYSALLTAQRSLVRSSTNPASDNSGSHSGAPVATVKGGSANGGPLSKTGAAVTGILALAVLAVAGGTGLVLTRKRAKQR